MREEVLAQIAFARADAMERVKVQASLADAALKGLMLANGGAIVALFTFVGNVVARGGASAFNADRLWWAFGCFVGGLVAVLFAYACAFVSQDRYYRQAMLEVWRLEDGLSLDLRTHAGQPERQSNRQGGIAYLIGLALAIGSIAAFGSGAGFALAGVLLR